MKCRRSSRTRTSTPDPEATDRPQRPAAPRGRDATSPSTPAGSAAAGSSGGTTTSTASPGSKSRVGQEPHRVRGEDERRHGRPDSRQGRGRLPAVRPARQGDGRRVHHRRSQRRQGVRQLENFEAVAECGGTAFIAFKSNATGGGRRASSRRCSTTSSSSGTSTSRTTTSGATSESTFCDDQAEVRGQRAVEDGRGDGQRSAVQGARHNLCVLIQEQHELGIEPVFWKDQSTAMRAV